jgi:hypothetical protein
MAGDPFFLFELPEEQSELHALKSQNGKTTKTEFVPL